MSDDLAEELRLVLAEIVRSPSCPEPEVVARQAAAVLADPPSSVFDPERFRANLERLATLREGAGRRAPEP